MVKSNRFAGVPKNVSCTLCKARDNSEWCVLSQPEMEHLNATKSTLSYKAGQVIFTQGNPAQGVYCVESGIVGLRKVDAEGNSILLRLAMPGHTVGYRAFFSHQNYAASAEVLDDATVCHIPDQAIKDVLRDNPALGMAFLEHLAGDLGHAEESILKNVAMSVRQRLVLLLLTFKDRFAGVEENGVIVISLPLNRQDLAALLGTRPETIARTINALEADHVAQFSGRRVTIHDLDLLLNEVEPE